MGGGPVGLCGGDEPPPGGMKMIGGIKMDPPGGAGVRITGVSGEEGKSGGMSGSSKVSELGS